MGASRPFWRRGPAVRRTGTGGAARGRTSRADRTGRPGARGRGPGGPTASVRAAGRGGRVRHRQGVRRRCGGVAGVVHGCRAPGGNGAPVPWCGRRAAPYGRIGRRSADGGDARGRGSPAGCAASTGDTGENGGHGGGAAGSRTAFWATGPGRCVCCPRAFWTRCVALRVEVDDPPRGAVVVGGPGRLPRGPVSGAPDGGPVRCPHRRPREPACSLSTTSSPSPTSP